MRCELELPLHFRPRQLERFDLRDRARVAPLPPCRAFRFLLPFFHPLGEAGFRVDDLLRHHPVCPGSRFDFSTQERALNIIREHEGSAADVFIGLVRVGRSDVLDLFDPAVRQWFAPASRRRPAAALGWRRSRAAIPRSSSRPTGSGKTLTAFLLVPQPAHVRACSSAQSSGAACSTSLRSRRSRLTPSNATCGRRWPGIANIATRRASASTVPEIAIRTGDTPAIERARFGREAADILITTPESLSCS